MESDAEDPPGLDGLPGAAREHIERLNAQLNKLNAEKLAIEQERDHALRKLRSTARSRRIARDKWKSAEKDLEAIHQRLASALSSHEVIHLGSLGDARLLCVLSRSPLFEVLLVQTDNRLACVKRKTTQTPRRSGDPTVFGARDIARAGNSGHVLEPPYEDSLSKSLLESELEIIRATRGAWNHEVIDLVTLGDGRRALVTPFHRGYRLNDFGRSTQRELFPRMLPALWRALAVQSHGDLRAENLIVQPQRDRFVIIDPCAYARGEPSLGECGVDFAFTTCPANYPLLAPYQAPTATLARGLPLSAHLERFIEGLEGLEGLETRNAEPHPADLLALGIMYYEILTSKHPFYDDELTSPGWLHGEIRDSGVTGFEAARARLERPITLPSDVDPSITAAEDALALSLLQLQVTTPERLIALVKELGL